MTGTDWLPVVVQDCRDKIRAHGFTVIAVGAAADGSAPGFAYTVGVSLLRDIEFVVSGLPIPTMHQVLSTLARKARTGGLRLQDDLQVGGVFGGAYLPRLRRADPGHPFGMIRRALGAHVRPVVWQAQFPDKQHRYPGDPGCLLTRSHQIDFTQPPRVPGETGS